MAAVGRLVFLFVWLFWCTSAPAWAAEVRIIEVAGAISPATSDFIIRNVRQAPQAGVELLVIQLDTPGGLTKSMRDIIKEILASPIPIATWVAPAGSRAASAGTYILYASHIAAMAPATNLGAATPVVIGGQVALPTTRAGLAPAPRVAEPLPYFLPNVLPGKDANDKSAQDDKQKNAENADKPKLDAMQRKIVNDASAYIRSLAQLRGRNVQWAELAVTEAGSLSAQEALEKNVIDFIAADLKELLDQAEGHSIRWDDAGTERKLHLSGREVERVTPNWRDEFLALITNPGTAYLLLMFGMWGLILEFYSPGIGVAGVTGVICLLIGAFGLQSLPISYAGLALMAVGIALMIAEAVVPSFGVFGIGGVLAFVVGSIILFDTEAGLSVPLSLILSTGLVSAFIFVGGAMLALKAHRKRVVSGAEAMLGGVATAVDAFNEKGLGRVRIQGEIWQARIEEQDVEPCIDDVLTVIKVDSLTLQVRKADAEPTEAGTADANTTGATKA